MTIQFQMTSLHVWPPVVDITDHDYKTYSFDTAIDDEGNVISPAVGLDVTTAILRDLTTETEPVAGAIANAAVRDTRYADITIDGSKLTRGHIYELSVMMTQDARVRTRLLGVRCVA
jgi:hypothetical protein